MFRVPTPINTGLSDIPMYWLPAPSMFVAPRPVVERDHLRPECSDGMLQD